MSLYLHTVYFHKMDMEQMMKDLQAQNAQFQQMFLVIAKGQEDLETLLLKDKKKKSKKSVGVLNLGRRLRGPVNRALDLSTPSNYGNNHEEDNSLEIDEDEADYSEEQ